MGNYFNYAVVRLEPDSVRGERLNIGLVVFLDDRNDIRISKRLDRARVFSAGLTSSLLTELVQTLHSAPELIGAHVSIGNGKEFRFGPLAVGSLGRFAVNDSADYELRVLSAMRALVDPEPVLSVARRKRSKLLTLLKSELRRDKVLAQKDEDLTSHRIVSSFELDTGLVADLALKNGAMHIVETVDASDENDPASRVIGSVAISALVFETARMKYGDTQTNASLVYHASPKLERVARPSLDAAEHQGAKLVNWKSTDERLRFVHSLTSLATPIETKRRFRRLVNLPNRNY